MLDFLVFPKGQKNTISRYCSRTVLFLSWFCLKLPPIVDNKEMLGTLFYRLYAYYICLVSNGTLLNAALHCRKKGLEQENWNHLQTSVRFENVANSGICWKFWLSWNKQTMDCTLVEHGNNKQTDVGTGRKRGKKAIKQLQLPHGISVYPPNTNSFSCTMVTVLLFPSHFSWKVVSKSPCDDWL